MQLHKRLTIEEVRLVLDWYEQKLVNQAEALAKLGLKRRQFFTLLKAYRAGKLKTLKPDRANSHRRIPLVVETAIKAELMAEKRLINDASMPVSTYNYQAVRDTVVSRLGINLSAQTVRRRAKDWGYHLPQTRSKAKHTRVVLTTATGLLLQHDASHHKWSPFADQKWCLITTIDDYSRMLLCAELFEEESAWNHILALKQVALTYGIGSNYYTDNHSIFRFTQRMETYWKTPKASTKAIKTQWERTVKECGMGTIYALSPEAKGKVERPYRWLQDRVVRGCAKNGVADIAGARDILAAEVNRYNTKQVHSTTGEIPLIRFQRAEREGNSVFRPLTLPEPFTSDKDVFCFKQERAVNGYSQISWRGRYVKVPKYLPEGARVQLHIIPDSLRPEIRIWYKDQLVQAVLLRGSNKQIN